MSKHLSQDQMSRCILGQASIEEEEHGRSCPDCRAELSRFTGAVSTFQEVMTNWSDWEAMPRLEEAANSVPWKRWAIAGVAIALLAAIPLFQQREPQRAAPEPETNKDELLMQEVAAQLSRPLPLSMERVLVLLPDVQPGEAPEREEIR